MPGSISNRKPQINKTPNHKRHHLTPEIVLPTTHRFREISALLSPHLCPSLEDHQVTLRPDVKRGRRGGSLRHCWWGAAAAGLTAARDSKPPTALIFSREVEVIFFPQVLSYLNTAPGSAVPLETFRQPVSSCTNSCFTQQGQPETTTASKKVMRCFFFPWTPIRDR